MARDEAGLLRETHVSWKHYMNATVTVTSCFRHLTTASGSERHITK